MLSGWMLFGMGCTHPGSKEEKAITAPNGGEKNVPENSASVGPDSLLFENSKSPTKIAFSSRANPLRAEPLWSIIAAEKPNVFVSSGDLLEPNFGTATDIAENFKILRLQPDFAFFRTHFPIFANWGNGESAEISEDRSIHEVAKLEYLKFFINDSQFISPRQSGIYHGVILGNGKERVHLIFLDTHFFRQRGGANPQLLGDEQWQWLGSEIQKPSEITVFVLSESLISDSAENSIWNQFLAEKHRLQSLLKAYGKITKQKNIFVIANTGFGEIRKQSLDSKLSLYEIAAGGINRKAVSEPEPSKLRLGKASSDLNYGLFLLDWKKRKADLKILGVSGNKLNEKSVEF